MESRRELKSLDNHCGRNRKIKVKASWKDDIKVNWQLYLLLLLPIAYILIFNYIPMYGAQIAFKDFKASKGILGSEWVGIKYFVKFFQAPKSATIIFNTVRLSIYGLIAGFPIPIILAVSLNVCRMKLFKKTVQMVTYAPYFISVVVMVGMLIQFLDTEIGFINIAIKKITGDTVQFMAKAEYFGDVYVWSGIWQSAGWSSIIYLAALSNIDPELHEAAIIDGASRFKRIIYIDIPGIFPTMIILLILNAAQIMNVGFEKVYLMQNSLNITRSEVLSTYVYKVGVMSNGLPQYSYATAIGLFNSTINFILIIVVNQISKNLQITLYGN